MTRLKAFLFAALLVIGGINHAEATGSPLLMGVGSVAAPAAACGTFFFKVGVGASITTPSCYVDAKAHWYAIAASGTGANALNGSFAGEGGGAGQWCKVDAPGLAASTSYTVNIAAAGAGNAATGTQLKNAGSTVILNAENGGNASVGTAGIAGGSNGTGVGTCNNGGAAVAISGTPTGGGSGPGAGGPHGVGANGTTNGTLVTQNSAPGGGGADGGVSGDAPAADLGGNSTSGKGGADYLGGLGGAAVTAAFPSGPPVNGLPGNTNGSGASGGTGSDTLAKNGTGGAGGDSCLYIQTSNSECAGPGGGGGAGGGSQSGGKGGDGGRGGLYGGAPGGPGYDTTGAPGAASNGILILVVDP